ncbi:MAG: hypothetical protein CM15mP62_25950 [Rhodospirillaceae bacterium]|nr:MAG: hypothetical protein CM15mP62_25950 [Rhodospirillaceae bacterium]
MLVLKAVSGAGVKKRQGSLTLGVVEEIQFLNSFFDTPEREGPQTTALRKWLFHQASSSGLILVTHQVNITALTGVVPSSGELVVIRLKKPSR